MIFWCCLFLSGLQAGTAHSNRQPGLAWLGPACSAVGACVCVWVCTQLRVYSKATWLEGNHVSGRVDKFMSAKHTHTHRGTLAMSRPNRPSSLTVHSSEPPETDLTGNVLSKIYASPPSQGSIKLVRSEVRHKL